MTMKPLPKGEVITDAVTKHIDRRFFNSLDLAGAGTVELTIDRVEKHKELVYLNGNKDQNALLIYFKEFDRPLKLCKTNITLIIQALGSAKAADWTGKKIKLAVQTVKAFGKTTPAVRVVG